MRIQTEQLRHGSLRLEFEEPADWLPALREMQHSDECQFTSPIHTRLRASRIKEMVEVEGVLRTTVRLTCGRCLAKFLTPLETEFALTYTSDRPGAPPSAESEEKEMDAREAGLIYFRGEEIDLTEAIQEQVILAFPLRPICREDCQGLCAQCGADLNQDRCQCSRQTADSPFAALGRLKLNR